MNIYKDVFLINKKHKTMSNKEIINDFNKVWDKRIKLLSKTKNEKDKEALYKLLKNKKYEEYIKLLTDLKIVVPFPDDLLNEMDNIKVLNISLKEYYNRYMTNGKCYIMSAALSLIFKENFIVNKGMINLPLLSFEHQWLEHDNKVYDTTYRLVFPKEYYYEIFSPSNIQHLTSDEIECINKKWYTEIEKNSIHKSK